MLFWYSSLLCTDVGLQVQHELLPGIDLSITLYRVMTPWQGITSSFGGMQATDKLDMLAGVAQDRFDNPTPSRSLGSPAQSGAASREDVAEGSCSAQQPDISVRKRSRLNTESQLNPDEHVPAGFGKFVCVLLAHLWVH